MKLTAAPTLHLTAQIVNSNLGAWTFVSHDTTITDSSLGDYSYVMQHSQIMGAEIGKFCSLASFVRLNPGNHPLERPSSHHMTYRAMQYGFADTDDLPFFARRIRFASGTMSGSGTTSPCCPA